MTAFIGVLGCPVPTGPFDITPAPPPPAPPAETIAITLTDDGLVWNGYGLYGGFEVTSQGSAGVITVYGGPDTTFPVVHQVTSPTTGETYYATGVTASDTSTYIACASIYAVHSGTSQTIEYILVDP
jgi:hypothetical protein